MVRQLLFHAVPTQFSRPMACRGARNRVFGRFSRLNLRLPSRATELANRGRLHQVCPSVPSCWPS